MKKKYNHPLLNELVDTCSRKRLKSGKSAGEFGREAGVDKQYIQRFEKGNLNPGLINADNLARAAGKKFVLININ